MTPTKDPSYFAYGLDARGQLLWGDPEFHRFPVKTLAEYERLFDDAGGATAVGEASTMYLECPQSAGRIKEKIPGARILCSIRHPVDRAYSDYLMYLRRRGRHFQPERDLSATSVWARPDSRWMQIGRYYPQLSRYYDAFPRDRIRVLLFDDLKHNSIEYIQEVYRFLEVDPAFVPDVETPHAPGGIPVSRTLEGIFLRSARSSVKHYVPRRAANWFRWLRSRTMRQPPKLPTDLRKQLSIPFHDDIARTAELIGRNLDHWR